MFPLKRSTAVVKVSIFVTILGVSHRKSTDLTAYFTIKLLLHIKAFVKRFAPERLLSLDSEVSSVYSDGRDRHLRLPSLNHFRHPVGTERLGVTKGLVQLYSEPRRQLSKNTVIFLPSFHC